MSSYLPPDESQWTGRQSKTSQYLHQVVQFLNLEQADIKKSSGKSLALLGYACDEGVRRNYGRPGAVKGPATIKKELARLANHLSDGLELIDVGSVHCEDGDMEATQEQLAIKVSQLLALGHLPILLGGGHDIAFGHYQGIQSFLGMETSIGIINFDAHFDLRSNKNGNHSGTPFYQIGELAREENRSFEYLCLGIQQAANSRELFSTANDLGTTYIMLENFSLRNRESLWVEIKKFIEKSDRIYITIDLDGFSSAFAPGVSAASPFGFTPEMVLWLLQKILLSEKVISLDIAEMNPEFDRDNQTAKLAAGLVHNIIRILNSL